MAYDTYARPYQCHHSEHIGSAAHPPGTVDVCERVVLDEPHAPTLVVRYLCRPCRQPEHLVELPTLYPQKASVTQ